MSARVWAEELMIYSQDEPAFKSLAKDFEEEKAGFHKAEEAYSCRDFSLILNRYTNLKQIDFYTHGNVGYVYLAGGSVSIGNIGRFTPPHPALFTGEGRVLFAGCNVGEGKEGRDFLIAVGRVLLAGRGGIVAGSTSKNLFGRWGLLDVHVPLWGDLRLVRLDAGGKVLDEKLV